MVERLGNATLRNEMAQSDVNDHAECWTQCFLPQMRGSMTLAYADRSLEVASIASLRQRESEHTRHEDC